MMITEGEYLFIYNSNKLEDKTAKAYALSIKAVSINERDIHKDHLTEQQIAEVAQLLQVEISELYDAKELASYEKLSDADLIKLLSNDPSKMKTPIILSKEKSFFVESSYELIKEQL